MLYPKSPFVLGRTKLALLVIFALLGACQASWVTVTPDVKNALELTTSGFGFVILGTARWFPVRIAGNRPSHCRARSSQGDQYRFSHGRNPVPPHRSRNASSFRNVATN